MPPKGTILIADDDEAMFESLSDQLESAGFRAIPAGDAEAALQAAAGKDIDLVIMGIRFHDSKAVEVLEKLKEAAPGVPVLVITDFAAVDLNAEAIKAGAFDLLQKPFTYKQLIAQVNTALRKDSIIDPDDL